MATIPRLIDLGLLPPGFGQRPDGSRVVLVDDRLTDSLRGAYGSFLPVPDVETTAATPSEVTAYGDFGRQCRSNHWWRLKKS